MRWIAYAEQLAPVATVDLDARRREIDDAAFELSDPKPAQRKGRDRLRLGQAQVALVDLTKAREECRTALWPEDEVADG